MPTAPKLPDDIRERLLQRPILVGLGDDDRAFLLANAWHRRLTEGTRFIVEDTAAEAVYFVLSGEVSVERDGDTLALQQAPLTVGLLSVIDGLDRSASVRAFSDVDVVMVPRSAFDALAERCSVFSANLVRHLTSDIRDAHRREAGVRKNFDDHFHSPNARLVQGPYTMGPFPMVALVVESTPERIRACLPPGIEPIRALGGRYVLTFNFFPDVHSRHMSAGGRSFAYNETTPFLPVMGPGARPAVFSPELYLDSYMPIVLGRELYGFPKRFGVARQGERHIDLSIGRQLVMRASWERRRAVDAGELLSCLQGWLIGRGQPMPAGAAPVLDAVFRLIDRPAARRFWPPVPVYVHSQVPCAVDRAGDRMRIDEIVEIPFNVHSLGDFEVLEQPALRGFADWILAGDVVGGVRLNMSATFGRARRVIDFMAPVDEGRVSRHLRPWRESARDLLGRALSADD